MRKLPETITEQELMEIIKVTKKKEHRLAYLLGFYECMRISEIVKLNKKDIDVGRGFIHILAGKGNKDRDIPIMPQVKHYLRYLPVNVGVRALEKSIKRHSKKAIDKDIHFHTLRHSGATFYHNEKKISIRDVQAFLGHSRLDTTQIYTHVTPQSLKKAFEIP